MFAWVRRRRWLRSARHSADLLTLARAEAVADGHEYVGTEHLLLAVCRLPASFPARRVLDAHGIDHREARTAVRRLIEPGMGEVEAWDLPFTPWARKVMARARRYAEHLGHADLQPEHVLLGILGEPEGVALAALGVNPTRLGLAVIREAGWPPPDGDDITFGGES